MATSKTARFFTGFMALLFLASASALVIALVVQHYQNQHQSDGASSQQANSQATQNQPQTTTCDIQQPVTGVGTKPIPTAYKASGTVSSLQVTDITAGTGQVAKNGDCLVMKYYGSLASNGQKFDTNFDTDNGLQFQLGQGQVIKGWDQGLVGMKVGGERRLVIPASLGYGAAAQGSIPANSDLVFDVYLIKIK